MKKKIIQVIGLPGSGKSTLINKWLSSTSRDDIKHIDIASFENNHPSKKVKSFARAVKAAKKHVLAESIEGVYIEDSEVVRLSIPENIRYKQKEERDGYCDSEKDWLATSNMLPPRFIVKNESAFINIIDKLLSR